MYEEYLMHHGVKGMKWGVRRYQNPDGSLTNAGKKRYLKAEKRRSKKKKISDMSDQELRQLTERKELEKRYKTAISKSKKSKKALKDTIVGSIVVGSTVAVGKKYATKYVEKAANYISENGPEIYAMLTDKGYDYLGSLFN